MPTRGATTRPGCRPVIGVRVSGGERTFALTDESEHSCSDPLSKWTND